MDRKTGFKTTQVTMVAFQICPDAFYFADALRACQRLVWHAHWRSLSLSNVLPLNDQSLVWSAIQVINTHNGMSFSDQDVELLQAPYEQPF